MKKVLFLSTIIFLSSFTFKVNAQTKSKFGHVDFAALYSLMPEKDSATIKYQKFAKDLSDTYNAMKQEFETKYQDFTANQATMSQLIQQTKSKELQDLQKRITDFEQSAQTELADKEKELSSPIIEKARKAVQDVAKENGFNYIFNSTEGLLLYAEPSDDVTSLVKKKLNLK